MLHTVESARFTELAEHNSKVSSILSPRGHAVASAVQSQLHVYNLESKEISHRLECDGTIDFIRWSPDSELICCGMLKDWVQVWNLDIPHFRCKISGCLAFVNVHWAPDSRHILVISEFYLKISVFSLASSVMAEIDNPKAVENGIAFSPCERFLVVAHRSNLEDYISVYSCDTWEAVKVFPVETKDLASITFSPKALVISILESAIDYKVLFYSIDGRLLGKYTSEAIFGVTSLNWNPVKNLVAVGDCLGEVKILECLKYELLTSYEHPDVIESKDITIYRVRETSSEVGSHLATGYPSVCELNEVVKNRPFPLLPASPETERGRGKNPLKYGVQTLQFSNDGKFIATISGHMPKVVFIYSVEHFKLRDVIIRGSNIKSISWHPEKPYLIICSSCNVIDMWTPKCSIRYLPSFTGDFWPLSATWSPNGECILMNSRDHFSLLFLS